LGHLKDADMTPWWFGRLLRATAAGCAFAFLPRVAADWSESGIVGALRFTIGGLMLPGSVIGLVVAGGMVHSVAQWVIDAADVVFYSALSYFLLSVLRKKQD
jgi:hypothetical protein